LQPKLESAALEFYNMIKRNSGPRKEEDQKAEEGKAKRLAPMRETEFAMTFNGRMVRPFPRSGDILEPYEGNGYPLTKR
jgi:hypothetical protein